MHKINDVKVAYRVLIGIGYCRVNLSKKVWNKITKTIKEIVKEWLAITVDEKASCKEG